MTAKKTANLATLVAVVLASVAMLTPMATAQAAQTQADRWLHVRVENTNDKGERTETVRVNLPLSLAEKVLPAIKADKLDGGKLKLGDVKLHGVDVRAVLEAVRTTRDGEFVTVQTEKQDVRVAKQGGYLLVQVREGKDATKRVDVELPFSVVDALLSGGPDELDLVAGVRALVAHGDAELITVKDCNSTVRIWVDAKNAAE